MTDASQPEDHATTTPSSHFLPPAAKGYRRDICLGRAVSVYCDRHPPNEWGEHCHPQDQISALLEIAKCTVRIKLPGGEWREHYVHGPAVWVIPADMPHALSFPQEADMITIYAERWFVLEAIERGITEFEILSLVQLTSRDELIAKLSRTLRRICSGRKKAIPLFVESSGTVYATQILQAIFTPKIRQDRKGGLPDSGIQRITRYIDGHIAATLSLDMLATAAGYNSTSHFGKLFRKSFGVTPHSYVMRRRVAYAQELLETTQLKEIEIAHACGFSDDTMMARWFRRVSDRLPSDIRP